MTLKEFAEKYAIIYDNLAEYRRDVNELLDTAYDDVFDDGYQSGYNDGYEVGSERGQGD